LTIKGKDIKILWGRSGNRCAICRIELTQDASSITSAFTLGEQAHIVGEKEDAPRGKSPLISEERDSYHNLILLCPNHHTEIDKNAFDWPVERLHFEKSKHELWVTETLSETIDHVKLANQAILSSIIDSAVKHCDLENWKAWTSCALSPDQRWAEEKPDLIFEFRQLVLAAVWPPEYEELQRSTHTLSILLLRAVDEFMKHSDLSDDIYIADRFYKRNFPNPRYYEDLEEFEKWQDRCYLFLKQATKAANWFAEVVRRDINPMFFAIKGKFLIEEGPFSDLSFRTQLIEFTTEEKANLPDSLFNTT
jgi:HNH endonuclease